jgi:gp16 family phage-associated protein
MRLLKAQIKAALKKHGYNMQHLADESGYNYKYVSNVLNGKQPLCLSFLVATCKALSELTGEDYQVPYLLELANDTNH